MTRYLYSIHITHNHFCFKGINNAVEAWKDVKTSCMNNCWRKLWPECLESSDGIQNEIEELEIEIAESASRAEIGEVDVGDIRELLQDKDDLSYEYLVSMFDDSQNPTDAVNSMSESTAKKDNNKKLAKALSSIDEALDIFREIDPDEMESNAIIQTVMCATKNIEICIPRPHYYRKK